MICKGTLISACLGSLIVVIVASSCARPVPSGGSVPDDSVPVSGDGVETPESDVAGLFDADEVWLLSTPTVQIGGFGGRVEFAILSSDDGTDVCAGVEPSAGVVLQGQNLSLTTSFTDLTQSRTCVADVAGDASSCDPGDAFTPRECDLTGFSGTVSLGDVQTGVAMQAQINRLSSCDVFSTSLDSLSEWAIVNAHPFASQFIPSAQSIGAIIAIGGSGESVLGGSVVTDEVNVIGCIDENITGGVSLEAGHLVIESDLQGLDNAQGTGTAGSCGIEFDGRTAYCVLMEGATFGQSGRLVRFDGAGRWTENDRSGELAVLYMLLPLDSSDGRR